MTINIFIYSHVLKVWALSEKVPGFAPVCVEIEFDAGGELGLQCTCSLRCRNKKTPSLLYIRVVDVDVWMWMCGHDLTCCEMDCSRCVVCCGV